MVNDLNDKLKMNNDQFGLRRIFRLTISIGSIALLLGGCTTLRDLVSPNCEHGICVDARLSEPIRINEPVTVTIRVETDNDEVGMQIGLNPTDPDIRVDGQRLWKVDTKAHQPIQVESIIYFPDIDGYFDVIAGAVTRTGAYSSIGIYFRITKGSITVNPPLPSYSGTPESVPTISPSLMPIVIPTLRSP